MLFLFEVNGLLEIGWFGNPKNLASSNGFVTFGSYLSPSQDFWKQKTEFDQSLEACSELVLASMWWVCFCAYTWQLLFMIPDLPNTKVQKGKPKTLWDVLVPEQAKEKKTHKKKCPFMERF